MTEREKAPEPPLHKRLYQLVAGAGSGAFTKSCIAPLDRIKILHQIQGMHLNVHSSKYQGIWQTGSLVIKEEGFLSLYKGNGANVLRVIPVYALKFMFNDYYKEMVRTPDQVGPLSFGQLVMAGSAAGVSQIMLTYPLELVRTRLALGSETLAGNKFKGIVDCFQMTVRKEGMKSLYKGIGPTLLSGTPYIGLQMTFYDVFKSMFHSQSVLTDLAAGACAGLVAQTITYPGDTLRRRMQTNGMGGSLSVYKNSFDAIKLILQREGPAAFFKGLRANIVTCIPGAAIQFVAYDSFKRVLGV
jgi:solute carrier family 25 phosphate transporter 23/24/25/41